MSFMQNLFHKNQPVESEDGGEADDVFLRAEPIARKRMDLLWLDPATLAQLERPLQEHESVSLVMGDSSEQREHDITRQDFQWAKQVEKVIDLAYAAGRREDYREAIGRYQKALELAPGCDLFLMSIGACYAQLGQKERALLYLERASEISPGNARIRDNLAKARKLSR